MKIGNVALQNNIFLAPMAGVTNLPFRKLCIREGCGLTYTEMISAKALSYEDIKTNDLMKTSPQDRPCGIQIFGSDPLIFQDVIRRYINDTDFEIIDINAGCPAPKIVKNGEGSALMKTPDLIGRLLEAAVKATDKAVTLKIRSGWDREHKNAVEVGRIAQEAGASAVSIHGRTRDEFYTGKADWEIIKELKEALDIPVIGNGDVDSQEKVQEMLDYTRCDGVMIGRAAMGNPWIFNKNREKPVPPLLRLETCRSFFQELLSYKPEKVALGEIRKHASWFTKGLRGSGEFRNEINQTHTVEDVLQCISRYEKELKEDEFQK